MRVPVRFVAGLVIGEAFFRCQAGCTDVNARRAFDVIGIGSAKAAVLQYRLVEVNDIDI